MSEAGSEEASAPAPASSVFDEAAKEGGFLWIWVVVGFSVVAVATIAVVLVKRKKA